MYLDKSTVMFSVMPGKRVSNAFLRTSCWFFSSLSGVSARPRYKLLLLTLRARE